MTDPFTPTKLERLITHIVRTLDREIGAIELAKLVYLADIEKYRFMRSTISDQEYVRAPMGPLPMNFDIAVRRLNGHEIAVEKKQRFPRSMWAKHAHLPGNDPRFDRALEPDDEIFADRALDRIGDLSPRQLERLAYETPPMQDVIQREQRIRAELKGERLDLDLVEPNESFRRWQKNMDKPLAVDPGYKEFLAKEMAEADELFASID